jgi:DNA invertase Pin-like site-specific DNA recombinase
MSIKVIGYVRVSTTRQAEEGVSIEAQEAKIRAWAAANDAEEVLIFKDNGISGKQTTNRPGLAAALEAVGPGSALVVYSLSRLARSTRDALNISELLHKRGADLVSLSEKLDTSSAAGKMIFRVLAVLAEFERDQVSERTRAALHYKRTNSEKTGGDVPFGYTARDGRLFPRANEQAAIRLIVQRRTQGASLRTICRELEDAGIKRKHGGRSWHPQAVQNIISCHASSEGGQAQVAKP